MEYLKYFDKNALAGYTTGPSSTGVSQAQPFDTLWSGYFNPNKGAYLQSFSGGAPIFVPQTGYPNTSSFSFNFDSGNKISYSLTEDYTTRVFMSSGSSTLTYQFAGYDAQLFNNCVMNSTANETYCFYRKTTDSIYYRRASESFSNERVMYSGFDGFSRLNTVIRETTPSNRRRVSFFGLDSYANGHLFLTSKFEASKTGYFLNFTPEPTGQISSLSLWATEEPKTVFLGNFAFGTDGFDIPPTGDVSYLIGNGLTGGYIIYG